MDKKKLLRAAVLLVAAAVAAYTGNDFVGSPDTSGGAAVIIEAFEARRSDVIVEADGVVSKILSDDNEGSRHQRLIVTVARDHTVLIAHNIDVAPRVENIDVGDQITFRGEYEYTERGGVVHWTHDDPDGDRPGGWIRHSGKTYR
jgi:hypothetical protein